MERCLKALLRQKLVHHDNSRYDGYRLTPLGYDFLALKALVARGAITAVGRQIGVGKESDVFEACPLPGAAAVVGCLLPVVMYAWWALARRCRRLNFVRR